MLSDWLRNVRFESYYNRVNAASLGSSFYVKRPSHDKQLGNMLANCWRQIELVSILTNFFTNYFVLIILYLTCERLANVSC